MWFDRFKTPIGLLTIAVDEAGLRYVLFENNKHEPPTQAEWRSDSSATREPREQLLEYFSGDRKSFDLKLSLAGTEFQQRTWRMLGQIPYGDTWSYAELATRVGSPKAVRAVGAANGRNPLPIVLPCHRVIGSNGSLTGFGGGLPTKKWLLELEGVG
jgi:methylated-DNA-[protein]-cysteine S-methyltransferase